jgi:methylated-DNA-[protein]-cysteine S-methyltransferase
MIPSVHQEVSRSGGLPAILALFVDRLDTPIGELVVVVDSVGCLRALHWDDHEAQLTRQLVRQYGKDRFTIEPRANPGGVTGAMTAYFDGDLAAIDGLPVMTNGTPFQQTVWAALREIPCGQTISYATLAGRIGRPSAVRAVGLANGANPVGIVIPCHRVIGSNGTLTGYGGGLDRKRWLLAHEAGGFQLAP